VRELGEMIVVWSWDGAHRKLVSVLEAEPSQALIETCGGLK